MPQLVGQTGAIKCSIGAPGQSAYKSRLGRPYLSIQFINGSKCRHSSKGMVSVMHKIWLGAAYVRSYCMTYQRMMNAE